MKKTLLSVATLLALAAAAPLAAHEHRACLDDACTLQSLLGHHRLSTTQIYNHVTRKEITATKSPFDLLGIHDDEG